MRFNAVMLVVASTVAAAPLAAQVRAGGAVRAPYASSREMFTFGDQPRVVIGVTTTSEAEARDTLGVLITSVRSESPADKAGLQEGDRIQSLNGVSLRLSPSDVGDEEMAGVMGRRLVRELDKLHPGDAVDLRVYSDGHIKSMNIKTVDRDDLETERPRSLAERAALGVSIGVNGTDRDTLGVLVIGVNDDGPAAKAGIQEGSRVASINGVDLRGHRDADEDDGFMGASKVNRLQREMSKLKPGQDADLRVYYAGQFRDVKVKAVRADELHGRSRSFTILNGGGGPASSIIMRGAGATTPRVMRLESPMAVEGAVRGALSRARFAFGGAGRVEW
jgi:serine protease Do